MKTVKKIPKTIQITKELWADYSRDGTVFLYKDDNDEWTPAIFVNGCYCPYEETDFKQDNVAAAIVGMEELGYFTAFDLDCGFLFLLKIGQEIKATHNAVLTYEE